MHTISERQIITVWVALVATTLFGALVASGVVKVSSLTLLLLILSAVKFYAITHWFMELKLAHPLWRATFGAYIVVVMTACGMALL